MKHQITKVKVGGTYVVPVSSIKNLGVLFDCGLSMDTFINSTIKTAFYHIYNIGRIRKYISTSSAERVIHALVSSRLDMANSLLYGCSQKVTGRLQRAQNAAARLITGVGKREHIMPILKQLHWLPVSKILVITYKGLHGLAPRYIADMLQLYVPTSPLRSSNKNQLVVPKWNMKSYGWRAFSNVAPRLWNQLPDNIKDCTTLNLFKSRLKTYFFIQTFT